MKTKEFNEAIHCYNTSITLDAKEATTYCNRALAFIKLKQYEKGLKDCNEAIYLKKDYSKAYYRRAACLIALNRFRESFDDLLFIFKDAPGNEEILSELTNLKEKWAGHLGSGEWNKIYKSIDEEIELAKVGKLKSKVEEKPVNQKQQSPQVQTEKNINVQNPPSSTGGFKKIKIVEEEIEEVVDITKKSEKIEINPTSTQPQQEKKIETLPEPQKNLSNKNDQTKIEVKVKEEPKQPVPEVHQEITDHLSKKILKFKFNFYLFYLLRKNFRKIHQKRRRN
jgi:tetratricopeptide (TPR) repeat protein